MNSSPALYKIANELQRRSASEIIDEFSEVLQLSTSGKDSLIDIGCGTGDVLMDFIYPSLSKTCTKIIGVDISPQMIEYSKNAYADYDKVDFKVLDVETETMPSEYWGKFDHVTSFFCLHWVQNQRLALKNIYNMLLSEGDCLLYFVVSSPVFDIYKALAAEPKWSNYMIDLDKFLPPYQKNATHRIDYAKLMKQIGFVHLKVDVREKTFTYETEDSFKEFLTSINPFIGRMPLYEQEEYMKEFFEHCKKHFVFTKIDHQDDHRCTLSYKAVVAYAKK